MVGDNGDVTFSRYGTTTNTEAAAEIWLPFNLCFFTDDEIRFIGGGTSSWTPPTYT